MNKTIIEIPEGISYISEWKDYIYPKGHCIVDKEICGCGFTEYVLSNSLPTVLVSPRKALLENKEAQHPGEVFYFKNEQEDEVGVDKEFIDEEIYDSTNIPTVSYNSMFSNNKKVISKQEKQRYISSIQSPLVDYLRSCMWGGSVPKILVTYDSLHYVLDVLNKGSVKFYIVIDEFQSIFTDARFKSSIELGIVELLQNYPDVLYLSATPMMEKYLDMLDEFKNLPYYEFKWPKSSISKISIERVFVSTISRECSRIIKRYRGRLFPKKADSRNIVHESKEVVFFVNSVRTICSIVKTNKMLPSETNILCAKNEKNRKRLKKIGHAFGRIPLKGEPHKMFTFCTKTTYLGADFYSTSASTVVCSDCNVESLALDISLDLPQIMGRQRLDENVFKNSCVFLYTLQRKNMSSQEYGNYIEQKKFSSMELLRGFERLTEEQKKVYFGKMDRDKELYYHDYIGISTKQRKPVYNKLIEISDLRAWEIGQEDYQNSVMVKRRLELENFVVLDPAEYSTMMQGFESTKDFQVRMKAYCSYIERYGFQELTGIPEDYRAAVVKLGVEKIKRLGYSKGLIEEEMKKCVISDTSEIRSIIHSTFKVDQKYTAKDVKDYLNSLYTSYGLSKRVTSKDIMNYFIVSPILIYSRITKKNDKGYMILDFR